jgi:alpha-glucosidase
MVVMSAGAERGSLTGSGEAWQLTALSQCLLGKRGAANVSITALTDRLVRIRVAPHGAFAPRRSWAVLPADEQFPPIDAALREHTDHAELATSHVRVAIGRSDGAIAVKSVLSGRLMFTHPATVPNEAYEGSQPWRIDVPHGRSEHYYGFGERTGLLDKRGRRVSCWTTDRYEDQSPNTDELYVAIPFLLSLDPAGTAYGILLNDTHRTAFDLTEIDHGRLAFETGTSELDYYLIAGPHPAEVVRELAALTGRMPLPPLWALGYHQSRWSYGSEAEVRAIAAEFRKRRIPADAICLDIDAMDGFRVFTWDHERFPKPRLLADDLARDGFRLVSIIDVGIKHQPGGGYPVYSDGSVRNVFVRSTREPDAPPFLGHVWPGLCAFPDFTRPEVREWWGRQYQTLLDDGVSGFLNDMNEPAMHDRPYDDPAGFRTDPPLDLPHGPVDDPATHAEVHNVYGLLEAQATYAGLRALRPDERPFLLTRAGFTGIQRYAGVWTGDNWSTWEHLEMSLPQLLNLGLSGVPFAGADIGGFFGNCEPELLVRWMQLGAFYPLARGNSAKGTLRQEPWQWGDDVEALCRSAIETRYRYLPYLYSVAEEASRTGFPILRPLFLSSPDDPATHRLHDQALVGEDMMIAPAVRPGQVARSVYLPDSLWYDIRTDSPHRGRGQVLVQAPLDQAMPIFARGGSIIPTGPVRQWTGEPAQPAITLTVYPDRDGNAVGRLYEDDCHTFGYESGEFRATTFAYRAGTGVLSAEISGSFPSPIRHVDIRLVGAGHARQFEPPSDAAQWEVKV